MCFSNGTGLLDAAGHEVPEAIEGGEAPMMGFETLTLAPFDRRLIVPEMLTAEELAWLNAYHARVWSEVSPALKGGERKWLKSATAAH